MTDDVRTSSIPTAADALAHTNNALALLEQAMHAAIRAKLALELMGNLEAIDARYGLRYGLAACDCGHPWGIHDVNEYDGDHSEMCCVTGCEQRGCPGPGCDHCYAETFAERWRGTPGHHFERGFDLTLRPERLTQPLRWKRARHVFVNSMSDLFHEGIDDDYIARVFAIMSAGHHTYQLLTKRHGRMRSLLSSADFAGLVAANRNTPSWKIPGEMTWPLPNVWLGVSVEDQKWADIRIPALLGTPAAVRWLSCEPLLGPIDLYETAVGPLQHFPDEPNGETGRIDWIVVGGESGPGARPMHPGWARSLRDQCQDAKVPFFFKQWGEWAPNGARGIGATEYVSRGRERQVGEPIDELGHRLIVERVGKKTAGRVLDGRTWDEYPEAVR